MITDKWWKEERGERVFVDFNQNAPHKNMFGAWGVRPRVGAQVSTPFGWEELETIDPEACTIDTVPGRVDERGDPWELIDDAECSHRSAGRAVRRRPGRRRSRPTLAAPVPEDAERGAQGAAQQGSRAGRAGTSVTPDVQELLREQVVSSRPGVDLGDRLTG